MKVSRLRAVGRLMLLGTGQVSNFDMWVINAPVRRRQALVSDAISGRQGAGSG